MSRHRILVAACFALICFCPSPVTAGEAGAFPVNPTTQPLLVLRANHIAVVETALASRLASAFVREKQHSPISLPGMDARISSLEKFLAALRRHNAQALWFCLAQGSIGRQNGAIGWTMDSGQEGRQATDLLRDLGLDARESHVVITPRDDGRIGVIVSRDAATSHAITGGRKRSGGDWQRDLDLFLSSGYNGVGVLAGGRPLFGLLSMVLGIDFRTQLSRFDLTVPSSIQAEFLAGEGDLGFEIQLHSILSSRNFPPSQINTTVLEDTRDPMLEARLSVPERMAALLRLDKAPLYLANLNVRPLLPSSATFSAWLDDEGKTAWSFAALMPPDPAFSTQLRRLVLLLEGAHLSEPEHETAPSGHSLTVIKGFPFSFVMGGADGSDGNVYWIFSGRAQDWPSPDCFRSGSGSKMIRSRSASDGELIRFRSTINQDDALLVASSLAEVLPDRLRDRDTIQRLLPDRDAGIVRIAGNSLVFRSDRGLVPFLLPALTALLENK